MGVFNKLSGKLRLTSDTSVTTQTTTVIQTDTTNSNIAIVPNGTGAIVASIPDGTATGGNARGNNAVDLQTLRSNANEVAASNNSFIGGGWNNKITGGNYGGIVSGRSNTLGSNAWYTFIGAGMNNSISGSSVDYSVIAGGNTNTISSQHSVISGGQSNTASTNTHATVVGGQSNTSSGGYSVSGGQSNTASGNYSVVLGYNNVGNNTGSVSLGYGNTVSGNTSMAGPRACTASNEGTVALGFASQATGGRSYAFGSGAIASGSYSVALGGSNEAYNNGMITEYAGDAFTTAGDIQRSIVTQRYVGDFSTGGTALLEIITGGSPSALTPKGNNRAWNVQVNWVAIVTSITGTATGISVGDVITSIDLLAFKKIAGISSASAHTSAATKTMVTTPAQYAGCQITYSAGTGQRIALTFTAPTFVGGGTINMRIAATLELVEVAF